MDLIDKETLNQRLEPEPGVLYVVGTPIGNIGDLSPRAQSLLNKVSVIACEDTRHSGLLLRRLGVKTPLISFYKHNMRSRIPKLLQTLKELQSLALISDAGMPGISDPGEELVFQAKEAGHQVICLPGPCAAITALVSSGLPSGRFCFEGFLPKKGKDREHLIEKICKESRTTVIYESPHRLIQLLKELSQGCEDDRPLQIARELTKRHEQQIGPTISAALQYFSEVKPLGECTVVLGGAPAREISKISTSEILKELQELLNSGSSANEACKEISQRTGYSKRFLYSLLHKNPKKNQTTSPNESK